MSYRSGFTLIEAVVTLFVITVALLGTVTGFIKISSLTQEIKDIVVEDKGIVGKMENIRGTDFVDITAEPETGTTVTETTVTVQIEEQPPVEIEVLEVSISSSWTSHAYPGKEITRTITFYVYEKGINWRP